MSMANRVLKFAITYPHKVALRSENLSYTFGDLDYLSTGFAKFLLTHGIRPGDCVAFCAPKSASLMAAILGCLKVGATYVPVDHRAPMSRILFILNDVAPHVVVGTAKHNAQLLGAGYVSRFFIEDTELLACCRHDGNNVTLPKVNGADVAYCLYTSGSTGAPKGVEIRHQSVVAFFEALAEVMPIDSEARCMNTSALHFDVHVMDIFFPLHRGAMVRLARNPIDASECMGLLENDRITHFTAVGPVMTLLAECKAFAGCDLSSLKRVMTGAEVINVWTMQKWLRKVPGLTLVNGYGPTETTVICTYHLIEHLEPDRTAPYPIGRPMLGTQVLLLDGEQPVTEPGCSGELLIAGRQVMKGYRNLPEQTTARIVHRDGKRFYRTGDICRWLPDGALDYVGRVDDEIKISGYRVSLSEIKRVMDATPHVREGYPMAVDHPSFGKVIAACVVCDRGAGNADAICAELQAVCKRKLPYYMVPSLYFLFDGFPLLPSGKTDRRQLYERVKQTILGTESTATRFVL